MPVFFVPPECITPPTASVTGPLLVHLRDSLRAEVGESILLADGQNRRYRTAITSVTKQALIGRIDEIITQTPPQAPSLILGQTILKGDRMDWVIQKTTELGVHRIIPIQSRRSIVHVKAERIKAQTARWQRIALEAAQQSEQWRIPTIAAPQALSSQLMPTSDHAVRVMLAERRDGIASLSRIPLPTSSAGSVLVLVGPEGGWTEEELSTAQAAGCALVTLGNSILRAETAATVAIGLLQYRFGELG